MQSVENMKKSLTDIEIAQSIQIEHIKDVAAKLGIREDDLEYYGKYKAKLPLDLILSNSSSHHSWRRLT